VSDGQGQKVKSMMSSPVDVVKTNPHAALNDRITQVVQPSHCLPQHESSHSI
jgi:hypothetical protein